MSSDICRLLDHPGLRIYNSLFQNPLIKSRVNEIIRDAASDGTPSVSDSLFVSRFMMSMLVIKYLLRPRLVTRITVDDVLNSKYLETHSTLLIKDGECICTLALHKNDRELFMGYIAHLRTHLCGTPHTRDLFINSKGSPVESLVKELGRFFRHVDIPVSTESLNELRLSLITVLVQSNSNDNGMLRYLNHIKSPTHVKLTEEGMETIERVMADIHQCLRLASSPSHAKDMNNAVDQLTKFRSSQWQGLISKYPIKRDGKPPTKKDVVQFLDFQPRKSAKQLIDLWLYKQLVMRVEFIVHILQKRQNKQPITTEDIQKEVHCQNWSLSAKMLRLIRSGLQHIKPQMKRTKFTNADSHSKQSVIRNLESQHWPGLLTVSNLPGRGRGVLATDLFTKGDVVCDYHGTLLSGNEGRHLYTRQPPDAMGYMMFFKHSGKCYCIDATREDGTYGRLINHSRLHPNILGVPANYGGNVRVMFVCMRDIHPGEELLYDYGKMKDASDIDWMKSCPGCKLCAQNIHCKD